MDKKLIFEEIKKISNKYNYDNVDILHETKLNDFLIDSMQVDDFFIDYTERFNLDLQNVDDRLYFFDNSVPFSYLFLIFKSKVLRKETFKIVIRIEHLVEVAYYGKWFEPKNLEYYKVK